MLTGIRNRILGRRLGRKLRASILDTSCRNAWSIAPSTVAASTFGAEHSVGTAIRLADTEVVIIPRRFRIFDRLRVYYKGHDVWLPLMARIRVRAAVRSFILNKAKYLVWAR